MRAPSVGCGGELEHMPGWTLPHPQPGIQISHINYQL